MGWESRSRSRMVDTTSFITYYYLENTITWKKREKSGGLPRGRAPRKYAFNYSKSPSCSVGWLHMWEGG